MRLIDADAFLERFEAMCETKTDSVISMVVRGALADEPTAYEVNKVVEKLEEVKNKDLWKRLYELVQNRKIYWEHVSGHSGEEGNEKVDIKCGSCMDDYMKEHKLFN